MSHHVNQSSRARGSNRGGCGGGYERTNPDFDGDKLRRLRADYDALEPHWRPVFLGGLSQFEQRVCTDRTVEIRD